MSVTFGASSSLSSDFDSDIAGSWYPSDKEKLFSEIAKMWKTTAPKIEGNIRGLILPHAGYCYSGTTAVKAFKTLNRRYKNVLVIGPSHRHAMKNTISVPVFETYNTPLGSLQIDKEKREKLLLSSEIFKNLPNVLAQEHSVQIEVPLLQYALKDFKVLFLITGHLSEDVMKKAGEEIAKIWDEETLVVASSDFTHYGERFGFAPFKGKVDQKINKLDLDAFDFIQKNDPAGFYNYVEKTGATICGATPLTVLLYAAGKRYKTELIEYTDSSKVMGNDDEDRVSYISAIMIERDKKDVKGKEKEDGEFDKNDRKILLTLARRSIEYFLTTHKIPKFEDLNLELTDAVKEKRAAFVTLTINSRLRGCIGEIFPSQSLYKSVITNALNAAFEDPRFSPLSKKELADIHIEISVLTIPKEIDSYKKIVIGRDGIILSKGFNKALFLPQVAPEQGWTLEETLEHLSMKAGLDRNAWRSGASFQTFQAEVFEEEK
jgi:AmmeMemoRadiSam system protein B/AmmeMemoRadiSam system protein A